MYKNKIRVQVPRGTEVALGEEETSQEASFLRGSGGKDTVDGSTNSLFTG